MKILVDASIVSKGGGVQVALAFLENISKDPFFKVICIVNEVIDNQLDVSIKNNFYFYSVEKLVPMHKKLEQGRRIAAIEAKFDPGFVFIIFGAAYWKPKAISLQGFALGKMLYTKELDLGLREKLINFVKKVLLKFSNSYFLVETTLVKNKLANYLNYPQEKIFTIGNSYSPAFYTCIELNRNKIIPNASYFQVLVPGSYYSHKNFERVMQAAEIIKSTEHTILFLFTLPENSQEWKLLYRYAQDRGFANMISTAGFVPNAKFGELYLQSNAILCASLVESSTAVFPEAFIAERPLLVSNRAFARELCEDAAVYFDPLNPIDIANAIKKVKCDPLIRDELIANGRKILLKNYPSAEDKWKLQKDLIIKLSGGK